MTLSSESVNRLRITVDELERLTEVMIVQMGNLDLQRVLTLLSWFCFADGRVSVAYLESVPYSPSVSAPLARKINGICTNSKPN